MTSPKEKLIEAFKQMAELTAPECAQCRNPHGCCQKEHCLNAQSHARSFWKENPQYTNHPTLPFMGWDGNKSTGCTLPPHLRPSCTLHTCEIQSLGYKKNDNAWTEKYFKLRGNIDDLIFELIR